MSQVSSATMMRIHSQNSQVTPVLFACCISAFPVHLHSFKRLWRGPSDPFNTILFSIERVNVTAGIKHAMQAGREESPFCLQHNCKYACRQRRPPFYYLITQVRQPHHCAEKFHAQLSKRSSFNG